VLLDIEAPELAVEAAVQPNTVDDLDTSYLEEEPLSLEEPPLVEPDLTSVSLEPFEETPTLDAEGLAGEGRPSDLSATPLPEIEPSVRLSPEEEVLTVESVDEIEESVDLLDEIELTAPRSPVEETAENLVILDELALESAAEPIPELEEIPSIESVEPLEEIAENVAESALETGETIEINFPESASTRERVAPSGAERVSTNLKDEIKSVLTYLDKLLESLPDEKIEEFARSEQFDVYKKLFEELGLV
jgi:pilus assembly protein FimV